MSYTQQSVSPSTSADGVPVDFSTSAAGASGSAAGSRFRSAARLASRRPISSLPLSGSASPLSSSSAEQMGPVGQSTSPQGSALRHSLSASSSDLNPQHPQTAAASTRSAVSLPATPSVSPTVSLVPAAVASLPIASVSDSEMAPSETTMFPPLSEHPQQDAPTTRVTRTPKRRMVVEEPPQDISATSSGGDDDNDDNGDTAAVRAVSSMSLRESSSAASLHLSQERTLVVSDSRSGSALVYRTPSPQQQQMMVSTLVLRTHEEMRREQLPIDKRYNSITAFWNYNDSHMGVDSIETEAQLAQLDYRNMDCMRMLGLARLKSWCQSNVLLPLLGTGHEAAMLQAMTRPCTFAAFVSRTGCGVRTFVTQMCRTARINLLWVRQNWFEAKMLAEVYDTALANQPCVVLFDRCDNWFDVGGYLQRGIEYISKKIDSDAQLSAQAHHSLQESIMRTSAPLSVEGATPKRLWTIVSVDNTTALHPSFLSVLNGEHLTIDPLTELEMQTFIMMRIYALMSALGVNLEANPDPRVTLRIREYVSVLGGDTPAFVEMVFNRAMRARRETLVQQTAPTAAGAASSSVATLTPFDFLPPRGDIIAHRTALCAPIVNAHSDPRQSAASNIHQYHPTQASAAAARHNAQLAAASSSASYRK